MGRTAIISVDGHVRASRAGYREHIERRYLDEYDAWVRAAEDAGTPDAGNLNPAFGLDAQWDSDARLRAVESEGVVAEVLFPNGVPFQTGLLDDAGRGADPELNRQGRRAYNRWLAEFCAATPGRRAGQALVSFDDVDEAVGDIHWAKEHGLGGIMMPPLGAQGPFFFERTLDPIWAACVEDELPVSQHGGTGAPVYGPGGFAAIMTLAIEHSFFSGRSLWQMILGGVFERFPDLRVVFVETEVHWIEPAIANVDRRLEWDDDWMDFAKFLQRDRAFSRSARDYWRSNCYAGISPFHPKQIPLDELAAGEGVDARLITSENAMFGVDYPHFESIFGSTSEHVANLLGTPGITHDDAQSILFDNAAEIYGFDRAHLQPHIDRVGFELATPTNLRA